jgi:hypothetical protein
MIGFGGAMGVNQITINIEQVHAIFASAKRAGESPWCATIGFPPGIFVS